MLKNVFKGLVICIVLSQIPLTVGAQPISPLKVGDNCPDLVFSKLLNTSKSTLRLSDMEDRLVILDVGNTGCPPCIEGAIQFSTELKERYGQRIAPIWIIPEAKEVAKRFLTTTSKGKKITIPVDCEYDLFSKYFPNRFYPFQIWIKNSKVLAITTPQNITTKNLEAAINGIDPNIPMKYDVFDESKLSLFRGSDNAKPGTQAQPINYSCVTKYVGGLTAIASFYGEAQRQFGKDRYNFYNLSILEAYQKVLRTPLINKYTGYILEVLDPSRYDPFIYRKSGMGGNYLEWNQANTYCYDSKFPVYTPVSDVIDQAVNVLNNSFRVKGRIETRLVDCWVISKTAVGTLLPKDTNFIRSHMDSLYNSGYSKSLKVQSGYDRLDGILWSAQQIAGHLPVIEEVTSLQEWPRKAYVKVSISGLNNIDTLNSDLSKYGLSVKIEKRNLPMLVITENGFKSK